MTPKYRIDFFDAYLDVVESTYWKRVSTTGTMERGLLTSHDNWGRNTIYKQSQGYIDYFRTQRWFSAPGYDDSGPPPPDRSGTTTTRRSPLPLPGFMSGPRVWNEAFHTSGWGRTTDETVSWLTTGMVFGANLYDEHGLYYATNASTWEHAAPDPHWRQPYWVYYGALSDFVARSSYLMSQGTARGRRGGPLPRQRVCWRARLPGEKGPIDYNGYIPPVPHHLRRGHRQRHHR